MNIFRELADLSHITAKCILIYSIHRNRSAEGVSLIMQVFYTLVFLTRYVDLFQGLQTSKWNHFFKVFYILSSFYTLGIMRFVYPRTREREVAWKLSAGILAGCLILSPFAMLIFSNVQSFKEWLWVFSQILEAFAVLPQLLLLRQTTVPTVITSLYIVFLGSYRGLYLISWIVRAFDINGRQPEPISVIFGIIQTAFYADFAWVYWTRQRVKLRNGGVVDADDMRRGWLLGRIFGNKHISREIDGDDDDEERGPAGGAFNHHSSSTTNNGRNVRPKWGSRGISVSADEGLLEHEQSLDDDEEHGVTEGVVDPDARMRDPDELAMALDEDEDDAPLPQASKHTDPLAAPTGIRNGDEWKD
ncbi:ER lumen protein retaining receptor-domain-containing protein [Lasiosphaeria ovina]|uniref:ER lumen protein retaining receptor-domain-containing protein n=1 Tax=Lasiosphaeria ovina TaxID=92902 RepID=A0AAE0NKL2_9PEZI|nr:ER lumen protein retaining receptor-domain-containing protein [Lasiosphaeria ovina]